jgi:Peptidase family M1 domain
MLLPFVAAAAITCAPPPAVAQPRADRPRYALNLRVASSFRLVTGDLTVTFTPNRATDRLVFRLWPNGPTQRAQGSRLDAGLVTSQGKQVRTTRPDPTTLVVRPEQPLAAGSEITVHMPWRLRVPPARSDRIARFAGGLRLGTFFPLLAWDPRRGWVTNPPARILAESSTAPAADYDLTVAVPSGTRAVVTGDANGPGRWHAEAVRDIALAVGRFRIASTTAHAPNPVAVRVATVNGSSAPMLKLAKSALERLSRKYGAYPWKTYTLVVPPDFFAGGIEYPMLVYVGRSPYARLIVDHETAHQWFYSLVGNDQARDPWLDETLATWAQTRLGPQELPPRRGLPQSALRHVGSPLTYWNRVGGSYYYGVYGEGVRALRSLGNNAKVDCALRSYAARQAYGIARPADLLDELNAVIPGAEKRLRAWGIRRH